MATQLLPTNAIPTRRWASAPAPRFETAYAISFLRPPYERRNLQPAPSSLAGVASTPGTIVCVRLSDARAQPDALRATVRDLAQRVPACPAAILLQMDAEAAALTAARLAPSGFRAVVPAGAEMRSVLRDALTDPVTLARDVIAWLELQSIRLNPNQLHLLGKIFGSAPERPEVSRLLEHFRFPQSSARFRLRKRGLPSPSRWFQVARALHAALRIQARPDASMTAIALEMGFADHSALAHLLRRCLGVQAGMIRGTLGWEWLLQRWCISQRILPR